MPNNNLTLALKATFDTKDAVSGAKDVQVAVSGVGQAAQTTQSQVEKLSAAEQSLAQNLSTSASQVQKATTASSQLDTMMRGVTSTAINMGAVGGQAGENISRGMNAAAASSAQLHAMLTGVPPQAAKIDQSLKASTLSAKDMSFALRGVPAQFTDIATSLASGQRPLQVFLQQGGQLKDMFGGAGPAAKALGGYVVGLINPLSVVLATSAGLAVAWNQGDQEARALNKSIILTGNAAGVTTGQLMAMSSGVAASTGATRGAAVEAIDMLVATGKVSADSINLAAGTAINMQRATGKAVADTVGEFEQLGKTPVSAYEKLAQQYGFLNLATRNQIKALEDQGRAQAAADLAQKAYGEAMSERAAKVKDSLGTLEKSWIAVADTARGAWDHMLGIGRAKTPDETIRTFAKAIEEENKTLSAALARGDGGAVALSEQKIRIATLALSKLQGEVDKNNADATQRSTDQKKASLDLENGKTVESISLLAQKRLKLAQITEIQKTVYEAGSQGAKEQANAIGLIRQQIAGLDGQLSGSAGRAEFIKSQEEAAYKYQHDAITIAGGELDRRLKNNLVSYETYYAAKRELARQDNAAEIAHLKNEIAGEKGRANKGTADEQYQSKARLIALQGQLNQAEADGAKQQSVITQQEKDSWKKYTDERLGLTVTFLELQDKSESAYALKFSKQYGDMLARMRIQGDQAGLQIAQGFFNFGAVKTQFDRIEKEFSRSQSDLFDAEKRIQIDQQAGLISEYEARQRLLDLRRSFIPVMEAELSRLNAMDKASMTPDELQRAKAFKLTLDSIRASASELNRTFEYGARNAIGRYLDETDNAARQTDKIFTDMFTGIEDVGANFIKTFKLDYHNLLQTMGNDLAHLLSRQYVVAPLVSGVGSALGMPGGAGGAGGFTGTAQNASSLYSAYSQFGTGTSTALNTGATLFGAQESLYSMYGASTVGGEMSQAALLAAQTADFGVAGTNATTAALASNTAATNGLSSTLGSAVPVIGGALTAYSVSQKYGAGAGMVAGAGTVAATGAIGGAMAGTGAMAGASAALAAVPVWGWAALAAMAIIGGQDEGLAQRTGHFSAGLGKSKAEGPNGEGSAFTGTKWFSQGEMQASLNAFSTSVAAGENALIKNLGLSTSQVETINAELNKLSTKEYGFNEEHTDWTQSLADEQITADRLSVIADSLGMTAQQVVSTMSYSLDGLKAAYDDAVLTDTEKLAIKTDGVREQFEKLGQVMPAGIAEYKKLVETQAAAGNSARPLYMELLKLGPAFVELSKSAGNAQSALEDAQKAAQDAMVAAQSTYDAATKTLQSAYQSEIAGKQALADQMGKYVQSMRGYRDSLMLGNLGGLSPEAKLAEAKRQMDDVARRAQLGDTAAMDQWQSVSSAFLESSQAYNASSAAYVQDRDAVLTMTQNLESVAGRQVDLQSQQISVLRSQLDALGTINSSVLSLSDARAAYAAAKSGLDTARGGDVAGWYAGIGRPADTGGLDYWSGRVIAGQDAAAVKADFERSALNVQTVEQMYQQFAGKSDSQIDAEGMNYWTSQMTSKTPIEVRREFESSVKSLQGFADGGVASAGYYIAHENELIYSDAATRIHPAEQTSVIFDRISRPAANDNGETVIEIRLQTAAIERQNQLLEKILTAVEVSEQANSADLRGLKQHLAHVMSRKAA